MRKLNAKKKRRNTFREIVITIIIHKTTTIKPK